MSLIPPHRSGTHRRRFIGGLLALVALGAVTVAPMHSAAASSSSIHVQAQSGFETIVDTDGDGASDDAEIAFGSDPNNANDYPEVQAGPESVDTDGDGASDEAEAAAGTDPNDASDFPAVQAGPEPGDGTTAETAEVATLVTALPNTGAQPHDDDDASTLLLLVSGAIVVGGLAGTRRLRNSR
jgi:hypothetical protein